MLQLAILFSTHSVREASRPPSWLDLTVSNTFSTRFRKVSVQTRRRVTNPVRNGPKCLGIGLGRKNSERETHAKVTLKTRLKFIASDSNNVVDCNAAFFLPLTCCLRSARLFSFFPLSRFHSTNGARFSRGALMLLWLGNRGRRGALHTENLHFFSSCHKLRSQDRTSSRRRSGKPQDLVRSGVILEMGRRKFESAAPSFPG